MGGRLLDYIAQGAAAFRPDPALQLSLIAEGAGSIYYAWDTHVMSFFNADTESWDELDLEVLTGEFSALSDVDFSTPPTDGQFISWNDTTHKLVPVDAPAGMTTEMAQDIVGAMVIAGTGITVDYNDGTGTIEIISNVTQYTDEKAQDAAAALLNAGTHVGISLNYNDAGDALSITNLVSQYTDEMAQDAISALLAAGSHTGISVSYNDAGNAMSLTNTQTQYTDEMVRDVVAAMLAAGSHTGITVTNNDGGDSMSLAVTGGGGGGLTSARKALDTLPALSTFTTFNTSANRTVTETAGKAFVLKDASPLTTFNLWGLALTTVPGTPYRAFAYIAPNVLRRNFIGFGWGFWDGATAIDMICTGDGQNLEREVWSSFTSRSSWTNISLAYSLGTGFWVVMEDRGDGYMRMGFSSDGVNCHTIPYAKSGTFSTTAKPAIIVQCLGSGGPSGVDAAYSLSVLDFQTDGLTRTFT